MWSKKRGVKCVGILSFIWSLMMQKHSVFVTNKKIMKDFRSGKVFPSSSNCIMLSIFPQVLHLTDKS